tara:strand:- start:6 stop:953 length:948 start_codon:yes stop_codon:yes gene_type:complete
MPKRKISQQVTVAKRIKLDVKSETLNGPNKPNGQDLPKHHKPNGSDNGSDAHVPSVKLPQLAAPDSEPDSEPHITQRPYQEVTKELQSVRVELDAMAFLDDFTNKWTIHDDLDEEDQKEFERLCEQYARLDKEFDNLLDLVKHKFMKWVECTEEEYLKLDNTSSYYYYINVEGNEIMQRGCWQFTSQHVQDKYQPHLDEHLEEYFYYGYPIYQHPDFEENTEAALAIENGTFDIMTANKFFKHNMRILEDADKQRIQGAIDLFNVWYRKDTCFSEAIEAFQELLPWEHTLACMDDDYVARCKLAWIIKKHHAMSI